jgi:hypothetical protein
MVYMNAVERAPAVYLVFKMEIPCRRLFVVSDPATLARLYIDKPFPALIKGLLRDKGHAGRGAQLHILPV